MTIWIVNPFDDLPDEAGRPLRYWQLCRTLAAQGHTVIWWSSDFSHRLKSYRSESIREIDGFQIRLVHTSPYQRNVGLARLKNHRTFGRNWEFDARQTVTSGALAKPDRIVVSLPPLETAGHAFRLRAEWVCPIVVDIQDAWPHTFLRLIPGPRFIREIVGRLLFAPQFSQFRKVCLGANKISACAQMYLDLAVSRGATVPKLLCYHGTRVDIPVVDRKYPDKFSAKQPLRLLYLGAMGRSYDLTTVIQAVADLCQLGNFISLHLVGQEAPDISLRRLANRLGVLVCDNNEQAGVYFHGYLKGTALQSQLQRAHVGLIPMDPKTLVGIPNKLVDYCATGLPVISCLGGETATLLDAYHAGFHYTYRNKDSLLCALTTLLKDPAILIPTARGSIRLAQERFDENRMCDELAQFVVKE
jgi:glycosyltransferase involved in cell wall biosynthesis